MSTQDKSVRLTFPVVSFRRLDTPFPDRKWGFAVVEVSQLPDLKDWRKINVRDPKLTGDVPRAIADSFTGDMDTFLFKNRGLTLSVKASEFDNGTGKLTVTLENPLIHGLLDGGHTNAVVLNERDNLSGKQYLRIELLEGFNEDQVEGLVGARNTSNQVQDESLMNLRGKFNKLKTAFEGQPYAKKIAYQEFEVDDATGEPKPVSVKEIIAILTAFNAARWSDTEHPINSYRSRAACLQYFQEKPEQYEKLYHIASDILKLYDKVVLTLPKHYNAIGGGTGQGGRFGNLTGVSKPERKKPKLDFTGDESDYSVPTGFVFPMLAAFRALLEPNGNGTYKWGMDPFKALDGALGQALAKTIGDFALEMKNPSKQGKSGPVWQSCYQVAEVAYLRAKAKPVPTR